MSTKRIAQDTAKVLQSYLTYQAVRTIIEQLTESNPTLAIWLSEFSDKTKVQNSESYLQGLLNENKELMLRVMTVREHLAEQILEYLPEMVQTGISQANMELRKQLLERITQSSSVGIPELENINTEPDSPSE